MWLLRRHTVHPPQTRQQALARDVMFGLGTSVVPQRLCSGGRRTRALVCAPSNSALDEIVMRLLTAGLRGPTGDVYRPTVVRVGVQVRNAVLIAAPAVAVSWLLMPSFGALLWRADSSLDLKQITATYDLSGSLYFTRRDMAGMPDGRGTLVRLAPDVHQQHSSAHVGAPFGGARGAGHAGRGAPCCHPQGGHTLVLLLRFITVVA